MPITSFQVLVFSFKYKNITAKRSQPFLIQALIILTIFIKSYAIMLLQHSEYTIIILSILTYLLLQLHFLFERLIKVSLFKIIFRCV